MRIPKCKWEVTSAKRAIVVHTELSELFNHKNVKYNFSDGQGKIIVQSSEVGSYSEATPSQLMKNCSFFGELDPGDISEYEWLSNDRKEKILVKLDSGKELYIIPYAEKPKDIMFSLCDQEIIRDSPFYAELGFHLLQELRDGKEFTENDPRVLKFVMYGILRSYNLNLDTLNSMHVIKNVDIYKLFYACCGVTINDLGQIVEEEVKKN